MAGTTKAKPTDFTGRQREQLAEARANELRARESEISTIQKLEAEIDEKTVTDYSQGTSPIVLDADDEVVSQGVELSDDTVIIRVAEELEMMTFGAGNHYDFKPGKQYKVPRALAEHLLDKGYLWVRAF